MSILIFIVMFALALIHIYWGHGGNWPGTDRQSLTDKVFGQGNQFPSIYSCYFVASILILAGIVPLFTENILFGTRFNNYSWFNFFIALPLMIRGVGGNLPMIEKRWTQVFVRNNRIIYSPLCIVLALSYILFGL